MLLHRLPRISGTVSRQKFQRLLLRVLPLLTKHFEVRWRGKLTNVFALASIAFLILFAGLPFNDPSYTAKGPKVAFLNFLGHAFGPQIFISLAALLCILMLREFYYKLFPRLVLVVAKEGIAYRAGQHQGTAHWNSISHLSVQSKTLNVHRFDENGENRVLDFRLGRLDQTAAAIIDACRRYRPDLLVLR